MLGFGSWTIPGAYRLRDSSLCVPASRRVCLYRRRPQGDADTLTRGFGPRKWWCKQPLAYMQGLRYTGAMTVREKILDAAARLYAETGYRGATTRRIAVQAGVNEITLFRQFGSKDALIREAIARAGISPAHQMLPESPKEPLKELREWAKAHIADLRERRSLIRTCMGEIEEHPGIFSAQDSPPAAAAKALSQYLRRLRESGFAKAQFDEAAASAMLIGALFADAMGRDIMAGLYQNDADEALEHYVQLFLRGLGVGRRRSSAS